MRILLIRHGKAQRDAQSGRDIDRELADRGRRQADWLADQLAADDTLRPGRVIASPASRTAQTAQPIADAAGVTLETDDTLWLASSADAIAQLCEALASETGETDAIALVSHEPLIASTIALLMGGPTAPRPHVRTGECFALKSPDNSDHSWTLEATYRADT